MQAEEVVDSELRVLLEEQICRLVYIIQDQLDPVDAGADLVDHLVDDPQEVSELNVQLLLLLHLLESLLVDAAVGQG